MNKSKKISYVFIATLILLSSLVIYRYRIKKQDIEKNIAFTTAKIISYDIDAKGNAGSIECEYKIENKFYTCVKGNGTIIPSEGLNIVGKYFPLVYSKKNNANNFLLITPNDFKEFNIAYPDSLLWVVKYLKGK